VFIFLLLLPLLSKASPDLFFPWESYSDPRIMSGNFEKKYDRLPIAGNVHAEKKYWSGDYWALNKGNINYRWHSPRPSGFNLRSPTRDEAKKMDLAELSHLAPSEKYDLYMGRYDYPLKEEVNKIADRHASSWEGICHGWAPASMNHEEPFAKAATNPDGIRIPFGSSDIKALISYYYAYGPVTDTHQMGRRCYEDGNDADCDEDLNAGAFHIVLTNKVGLSHEGIIIDLKRGQEVWNHPITSFKSEFTGYSPPLETSAPGTTRRAKIKTSVKVVLGTGNYWETVKGTSAQKEENEKYVYYLDLSADNEIIGGDWESKERPDFLWVKYRSAKFEGLFWKLPTLLNDK
jgi:hypothetical protein